MVMVKRTGDSSSSLSHLLQFPGRQAGRGLHTGCGRHDVAAHHDVRLGDGLLPHLPGGEVGEGGVLGGGDGSGLTGLRRGGDCKSVREIIIIIIMTITSLGWIWNPSLSSFGGSVTGHS